MRVLAASAHSLSWLDFRLRYGRVVIHSVVSLEIFSYGSCKKVVFLHRGFSNQPLIVSFAWIHSFQQEQRRNAAFYFGWERFSHFLVVVVGSVQWWELICSIFLTFAVIMQSVRCLRFRLCILNMNYSENAFLLEPQFNSLWRTAGATNERGRGRKTSLCLGARQFWRSSRALRPKMPASAGPSCPGLWRTILPSSCVANQSTPCPRVGKSSCAELPFSPSPS